MSESHVRVAVVGAGTIGRGWAALCVAGGWPVHMFDTDARSAKDAPAEVAERARKLVELGRATEESVERGIASLEFSGSLLRATRDAQWVIESIDEDIRHKQKLLELLEETASSARVVTSSTSSFTPQDLVARCQHRHRIMIAHPLNPPELIPLVELIPDRETNTSLVELVRGWLHALGRIGIVIRKPVPGHVVNRIAAAVWREAIDLVLEGVIDVDNLDRAVSLGPALGWAAAGPHLSYHLAAGERGVDGFLQVLLHSFEKTWESLADWSKLEPEQRRRLTHAVESAYEGKIDMIRAARDRRLAAILRGMEEARRDSAMRRKPQQ